MTWPASKKLSIAEEHTESFDHLSAGPTFAIQTLTTGTVVLEKMVQYIYYLSRSAYIVLLDYVLCG